MKTNICLIFFGVLIAHVVLSTAENTEDKNNLSEVALSRISRAANADPGPGRNKANKKNKKTKKVNRKNKKAKKNNRKNKKSKKANRRNKKSKKANRKNKKSKKANRKNKKSKKANRKNKKSKKANRKNKKSKKANRKNKKSKKANKKRTKKQNKSRTNKSQKNALRQDIPEICLTEAVKTLYNGLARKASNFDTQMKRTEKRVPIIKNKLEKAGDYKQAANNMANIVPSCPANLTFTADSLTLELWTCEASITEKCKPPIYNQTQIDECKPVVTAFMQVTEVCFNSTRDETGTKACECWESEALKNISDALAGCIIDESNKNVTLSFKECKNAVSECNKAETDAGIQPICRPIIKMVLGNKVTFSLNLFKNYGMFGDISLNPLSSKMNMSFVRIIQISQLDFSGLNLKY